MFNRKSRIQQIQEEYQRQLKLHDGKPDLLIPANEVWRLFVEGKAQKGSKQIAAYFKEGIPDCSVREFAQHESKGGGWRQAPFIQFLQSKHWYLNNAQLAMRISDFLILDQAWLQYENEAGYLTKLYLLYPKLFDFSVNLDAELILSFHQQAVSGVKETAYKEEEDEKPGSFRRSYNCGMVLFTGNFSEKGIFEWLLRTARQLKKQLNHQLTYTISVFTASDECLGVINLDYWSVTCLREYIQLKLLHATSTDTSYKNKENTVHKAWKAFVQTCCSPADREDKRFLYCLKSDASINSMLEKIGRTETNEELAHCLFDLTHQMNADRKQMRAAKSSDLYFDAMLNSEQDLVGDAVPAWLYAEVNKLFDQFSQELLLARQKPLNILSAIIALIQDLHQLHPFLDGNGRTLCILLFNHLLLRHGFPPCMIEDTAVFSLCSRDEIMQSVLDGLEQTLQINKKVSCSGPSTAAVLTQLAAHPALHSYLEEFNAAVQNEEWRRQEKKQHVPASL
jgi:hypothetical protein